MKSDALVYRDYLFDQLFSREMNELSLESAGSSNVSPAKRRRRGGTRNKTGELSSTLRVYVCMFSTY